MFPKHAENAATAKPPIETQHDDKLKENIESDKVVNVDTSVKGTDGEKEVSSKPKLSVKRKNQVGSTKRSRSKKSDEKLTKEDRDFINDGDVDVVSDSEVEPAAKKKVKEKLREKKEKASPKWNKDVFDDGVGDQASEDEDFVVKKGKKKTKKKADKEAEVISPSDDDDSPIKRKQTKGRKKKKEPPKANVIYDSGINSLFYVNVLSRKIDV